MIGSTSSVNAITNIGSDPNVPIYNLDGLKVANDATTNPGGLFAGSLFTPLDYDENGAKDNTVVFTGTNSNGTTSALYLGDTGDFQVATGNSSQVSTHWISTGGAQLPNQGESLYAISGVFTVGGSSSTPEPTTTATMIMGMAFLYLAARRRHRIRRAD